MANTCTTMAEVREQIDRIDRELVHLLAERQRYIEQAGHIKPARDTIRDIARIEDVIRKIREHAAAAGLSPEIAEPIWRELIERSITHEMKVFDQLQKKTG